MPQSLIGHCVFSNTFLNVWTSQNKHAATHQPRRTAALYNTAQRATYLKRWQKLKKERKRGQWTVVTVINDACWQASWGLIANLRSVNEWCHPMNKNHRHTHKLIFSDTDHFRTSFLKAHTPTVEPFNASLRDSLAVIYTSHHGDDEGFAPWFSPNADCSPTLPADLRNPDPDARWQV